MAHPAYMSIFLKSSKAIGVPTMLTDEIRRWGPDGLNRSSQVERRRTDMTLKEAWRCLKRAWCFEQYFGSVEQSPEGIKYVMP